ncbi:hypothetical protein H8959_020888, partial [Pygathrix nigripes]
MSSSVALLPENPLPVPFSLMPFGAEIQRSCLSHFGGFNAQPRQAHKVLRAPRHLVRSRAGRQGRDRAFGLHPRYLVRRSCSRPGSRVLGDRCRRRVVRDANSRARRSWGQAPRKRPGAPNRARPLGDCARRRVRAGPTFLSEDANRHAAPLRGPAGLGARARSGAGRSAAAGPSPGLGTEGRGPGPAAGPRRLRPVRISFSASARASSSWERRLCSLK